MILTDSEVGSLKAALNCWEWFADISTAIVWVGCAGEYIAEFTRIPKSEESRKKWSRLSLIVLLFGIAGEFLGTIRTSQLSGQVIANVEVELKKEEGKTAQAQKESAVAQRDLKEFVDRLSRTARHRAINNRAFIWGCIVGKPIGNAEIWYKADEPDEPKFANDLYHALKSAPSGASPWVVSEPKPFTPTMLHGPHMRNIVVVGTPIDFHFDREDKGPFGALRCALTAGVDGPGLDMFWEDKTLPANHFVITIYGREDTAP